MLILNIFILVALIKLLLSTDKPVLCAGIYAGLAFLFSLMTFPLGVAVLAGAIRFVLAFIYFWLLSKFEGSGLWWLILIGGLLIVLV